MKIDKTHPRWEEITEEWDSKINEEHRRRMMNECYNCRHKREVPGNCHIQCAKPDANMTGNEHGIREGWFMYPILFDPTWKTKMCDNFEAVENTTSKPCSKPSS